MNFSISTLLVQVGGCCLIASTSKLNTAQFLTCPCGSQQLQIEDAPLHSQKVTCADCERFIKWLPKVSSCDRHLQSKQRLERLNGKTSGWNSTFINDLLKQCQIADRDGKAIKLSPRQLTKLAEIEASVMGGEC